MNNAMTPIPPSPPVAGTLPELPQHVASTYRGKTRNAKWTHVMLHDSLNFPGGKKLFSDDQMRSYALAAITANQGAAK
jgi:hypothetical protein